MSRATPSPCSFEKRARARQTNQLRSGSDGLATGHTVTYTEDSIRLPSVAPKGLRPRNSWVDKQSLPRMNHLIQTLSELR